jgi:uncharacterized caspase-like protein
VGIFTAKRHAWILACTLVLAVPHLLFADPKAAPTPTSGSEQRVALVIGNGRYHSVTPLQNPPNDARLIGQTLASLGFQIINDAPLLDADRATMERAIRAFGKKLRGGAIGLFYYAGHGVQIDGENYLVPVSANVEDPADVKYELIGIDYVLDEMRNAGNRLNIVILDACRNNPFGARGLRGMTRGLAIMQAPAGTIISYATQPGATAADGSKQNSPFSTALAASINMPGRSVFETFNDIGLAVKSSTGGQQQPWFDTSPIEGDFQFRPATARVAAAAVAPPVTPAPSSDTTADERAFWESVRDSKNPAELKAYLTRYPHGTYSVLAKSRLTSLQSASGVSTPTKLTDAPSPKPQVAEETAPAAPPSGPPAAAAMLHYNPGAALFFQKTQTTSTPVSTKTFAPLPESAAVTIFESPARAPRHFEVIATIQHADPCKMHTCTLKNATDPLSAKARELGANGIIIDNSQIMKTSVFSTGIAVDARAIRFTEER